MFYRDIRVNAPGGQSSVFLFLLLAFGVAESSVFVDWNRSASGDTSPFGTHPAPLCFWHCMTYTDLWGVVVLFDFPIAVSEVGF